MIRLQYDKTVNNPDYVYQATNHVMFNVHTCVCMCYILFIYIYIYIYMYNYTCINVYFFIYRHRMLSLNYYTQIQPNYLVVRQSYYYEITLRN